MRVYIAGPMSGYPDLNFPAFHAAATRLRLAYEVVSPAEQGLDGQPDVTWADCMRHDIKLLMDCDLVAVLPGWERSRGASIEVTLARSLGLPIIDAITMEPVNVEPIGGALDRVVAEAVTWANETFGAGPGREAAKAEHLRREAVELAADPTNPEEMADVLILLAHLAAGCGVDLERAVREKLAVLRTRTWGEPDADGVVEHVRGAHEDGAGAHVRQQRRPAARRGDR